METALGVVTVWRPDRRRAHIGRVKRHARNDGDDHPGARALRRRGGGQGGGVDIGWGNVLDAFNAIIADIDAHDDNQRTKDRSLSCAVQTATTAPADRACTQLTEESTVLVAIAPLPPTCYLQHHKRVLASFYPVPT